MYYEVYVDVLFVENLWMNLLLLWLLTRVHRISAKKPRVAAAAAAGSLGACLMTIFSAGLTGAGYFLGSVLLAAGMVRLAFGGRDFFSRLILLYISGFAVNGILRYQEQFYPAAGLWLCAGGTAAAGCLSLAECALRYRKKHLGLIVQTELKRKDKVIKTEALYDTGNGLFDPVSGRPVSILDGELLRELLLGGGEPPLPHMVPYHTISQGGILEAYILDEMILFLPEGKRRISHPMVASMPGKNSRYSLILHRDMLSS